MDTPELLQLFKDGEMGRYSKVVYIEPNADPNVFYIARQFFNRTTNDEIRFKDRPQNLITIHPKNQSVHARFINGSHMTYFLPGNYRNYNLTFVNRNETNNMMNLRDIYEFQNATTLTLGNGFDVRSGYENVIRGMQYMKYLKELTVDISPKYSTVQLTPFLVIPPAVTRVRVILPANAPDYVTQELAANQCPPPEWEIISNKFGEIYFEKTYRDIRRPCWQHFGGRQYW